MLADLVHEISQTLSHNKTRTTLTGIAVVWGIFMLIVLLGMSQGVQNQFKEFASSPDANNLEIWGGWTSRPYKGYQEWRRIRLKDSDIKQIRRRNSGISGAITANVSIDTAKIYSDRDYLSSGPNGVFTIETDQLEKVPYGRRLNQRDLDEKRRVMIIESRNAEQLFGDPSKAVGQTVKCMGLAWTIVGVYQHDWRQTTYIPYTTALALKGGKDEVNGIYVEVRNLSTEEEGEEAERQVRQTLAAIHDFDPDDTSAVHIWNQFTSTLSGLKMNNIMEIAVWLLGFMTLLSGIVGVSNIMFVSVRERTHEIGVRRAIGAKPIDIVKQIILEGVAITTLFGYIGILLGTVVIEIIDLILKNSDSGFTPVVSLSIAVRVTIVLIVCGALAALFPALKATKVKPVEALRDE